MSVGHEVLMGPQDRGRRVMSESTYVKCGSNRARHKLYQLCGGPVPDYFTIPGFTHYHQVPAEFVDEALKITGVTLGKPRGELCLSWSFK